MSDNNEYDDDDFFDDVLNVNNDDDNGDDDQDDVDVPYDIDDGDEKMSMYTMMMQLIILMDTD